MKRKKPHKFEVDFNALGMPMVSCAAHETRKKRRLGAQPRMETPIECLEEFAKRFDRILSRVKK